MTHEADSSEKNLFCTIRKLFCAHPHEAGENYLQHLWFTLKLGMRLLFAGVTVIIHGIFPFLCTHTASKQIECITNTLKNRNPTKHES